MGRLLVAALATLVVVFGASAASKVAGLARQRAFARSLRALRLLPGPLVVPVAAVLSCVELLIATGLVVALLGVTTGAPWAISTAATALLAAVAVLVVLTAGIVSALIRRTAAPCACFGASERPLSRRHVVRNALMLIVGTAGAAMAVAGSPTGVDLMTAGLAGAAGVIVAVVLIRLDEIVELFAPAGPAGRTRVRS